MKKSNLNTKRYFSSLFAFLGLTLILPSFVCAQMGPGMYGGGSMYGMGGMGGMGQYGYQGGGGMQQGPGSVIVKYGEKVYDAVFGDLIDYKVYYLPMTADQIGVNYFDDGTHGDEVAYDGMPSNIIINNDTYLGPFSIKYKRQLKEALRQVKKMGAFEFYGLLVATEQPNSLVSQLPSWEGQFQNVLSEIRDQLSQFEGYDDEEYVKVVDPALFESLEGFGGTEGGVGQFGMLPDLPTPPGMAEPSVRMGMPEEGAGLEQGMQTPQTQQPRPFRPTQRAQETVEGMNTLQQP